MKGKFWSEEEDNTIMEMRKQGASWGAVARALGRESPTACANRWYRLRHGASSETSHAAYWAWDEDELIRKAYMDSQADLEALANELGRTVIAVRERAKDLGCVSKLSKRDAGDGSGVRKCHDCGKDTHNFRCPACLKRWRAQHGVPLDGGE